MERRTLSRWFQHGSYPERKQSAPRSKAIDRYRAYLQRRWKAGVRNAALLFREVQGQGFSGSYTAVRDLVQGWRAAEPRAPQREAVPTSIRQSAWLLTLSDEERTPEQKRYLEALTEVWPDVRELERLAREFVGFFREKDAATIGT